jgi:hypothetical protein
MIFLFLFARNVIFETKEVVEKRDILQIPIILSKRRLHSRITTYPICLLGFFIQSNLLEERWVILLKALPEFLV